MAGLSLGTHDLQGQHALLVVFLPVYRPEWPLFCIFCSCYLVIYHEKVYIFFWRRKFIFTYRTRIIVSVPGEINDHIYNTYLTPSRAHYAKLRFLNGFMFFELSLALGKTWCKPFFDCMSQTREKISFPVVNWRQGATSDKKAQSLCLHCVTQVSELVLILFFCREIQ